MRKSEGYIVITGASAGIGWAAAKAFAARGRDLILIARRGDRLERLRQEIAACFPAVDVVPLTADLSCGEAVVETYARTKEYPLWAWINNAGRGHYGSVGEQDLEGTQRLLRLDIEAVTLFSTLFVRDYREVEGAQLINVSSSGGYTIVPNAVTYCAAKFYVSAFTEGLDRELRASGAKLRAKVFAPAATKTEFGQVASHASQYDYDAHFPRYHTSAEAAALLLALYDGEQTVGLVDRETFAFQLEAPRLPYAGSGQDGRGRAPKD